MRQLFLLLLLLFGCSFLNAGAQTGLQTNLPLAYLVQQPTGTSGRAPMLILMHGYGSNETDLFSLRAALPSGWLVVSLRAPIVMGQNAFQWFRMEGSAAERDIARSAALVKAMIPALVKKYGADPGAVYLAGFSQGGMMSYEVGLTAPALLRGIAPLSGKVFASLKSRVARGPALSRLRLFIGHGDADSRVPYAAATEADAYLHKLGLKPELHTYKGMAHSISEEELGDLVQWLTHK